MTDDNLAGAFRAAMRRLATTVAIITAGEEDGWTGMAATAVVSVCADPPTILIAVNRGASIYPVLVTGQRFCVNLLAQRHQNLVGAFSGERKGLDRFGIGDWIAGEDGLPVLTDALASLSCRVEQSLDAGTHTLFLGQVERVVNHDEISPLIWVDGGFASLSPAQLQGAEG